MSSHPPHIDWSKAEVTDPGATLRVPVAGATPEWCTEFKVAVRLRAQASWQDAWGQIGLIGYVIFVPAVGPGSEDQLRAELEELVAAAQRRVAAAPPPASPEDMLELFRSLSS